MHVLVSSRGARALVATFAAVTLTACTGPGPGVAASVDGAEISDDQVDDFAGLLCSIGGLPGAEEAATKTARQQALSLLIGNELAFGLIDEEAVDPAVVQQAVQQNAGAREGLPEDQVEVFDAFVEEFSVAQIGLVDLGRQSLLDSGTPEAEITDDAAFAEGQALRQAYAAEADIEVDPRFGSVSDGVVGPDDTALSVPVTDIAKQGAAEQPPETFGSLLPANQKCG